MCVSSAAQGIFADETACNGISETPATQTASKKASHRAANENALYMCKCKLALEAYKVWVKGAWITHLSPILISTLHWLSMARSISMLVSLEGVLVERV